MRNLTSFVVLLVAVCCLANSAQAGTDRMPNLRIGPGTMLRDVIVPADWGGIWQFDDHTYDCGTNELLGSEAYTDTICAGAVIDFSNPEFQLTCTGTADANAVSVECTGSFPIFEGCAVEYSTVFTATRSGDTMESVQTVSMTFVPTGCAFQPDDCTRTESTATRIAPQPNPCEQTPVETVDWGTVKSLYR